MIVAASLRPVAAAARRLSARRNLTNGRRRARSEIRFRYVRTEPIDSDGAARVARAAREFDLSKPLTLSAYGEYTKKAGLLRARGRPAEGARLRRRVVQHAGEGREGGPLPASRGRRSRSSRTCASPGPDFKDAKKITDANPQQAEYSWGRRVLFDYKNKDGDALQGILALPDDYKPGEKRPMIVKLLREELAEPASLHGAVVPHRHGLDADGSGEPRLHHDAAPTSTSTPARRTATCSRRSRPRRRR